MKQAQDASMRAKQLQDLQHSWHDRLMHGRSATLPIVLADSLIRSPIITIPQAERLVGVTYVSARRNVEKLIEASILNQLGDATYDRPYAATEILNIISEGTR